MCTCVSVSLAYLCDLVEVASLSLGHGDILIDLATVLEHHVRHSIMLKKFVMNIHHVLLLSYFHLEGANE